MNWPIYFYTTEFFWRLIYFLFGWLNLNLIIYIKMDSVVFLEILPFFDFGKRFIVLGVTDLIELFWFNCLSLSSLFTYPLFTYHLIFFFKSSWYYYQSKFASSIFFWWALSICSIVFILSHEKILPNVLVFFTQHSRVLNWNQTALVVETQLNTLPYVIWILEFHYLLNFWTLILFYYFIILLLKNNSINNYLFIKSYSKTILFSVLVLIFLVIPPDLIQQLTVIFLLFMFTEILFLFICIRLTNNLKVKINANYSPIT
uniref:twin arginine protein translocation system - TatC protein n=1 Tax=Pterocladiella capillacea TaxID=70838 RepID=UPI002E7977C8|nr:twin arginine protein translocation system - TatC protein [Pterocladiella capillacea]WQB61734.1 twin arginine protein translocation system - TatC protein [Pterocladiella capillacea]